MENTMAHATITQKGMHPIMEEDMCWLEMLLQRWICQNGMQAETDPCGLFPHLKAFGSLCIFPGQHPGPAGPNLIIAG